MSVYFFHLRDGLEMLADPDGREIDHVDHIAGIALREARAIIGHEAAAGTIYLDKHIHVANESGAIMHRLSFSDAVTIVAPGF